MKIPLQQHPNFANVLNQLGRDASIAVLRSGVKATVLKRKLPLVGNVSLVTRGPVWLPDTVEETKLNDLLALRPNIINAEINDVNVLRAAGYRRIMTPAYIACLDITGNAVDRRARLLPKWRASLKKTPSPIILREFDPCKDNWLFENDLTTQKSQKYRSLPHEITVKYAQLYPHDTLFAKMQTLTGPIAAMLFLRHGDMATYHIAWTSAEGRAVAAHHHLFMESADRLARLGVKAIDLGQVNTVDLPGLARFKIGTGAKISPLGGTWLRLPGCHRRLA